MPERLVAHRGASARWPEHTRAAYLQALEDGADGLECDVRLTSDGVAVCWHDATVDRTSDGTGAVAAHTLAELRALDVLRGAEPPSRLRDGPQVLTLAELVDLAVAAGRSLVLAIELKHPAPAGWAAERAVLEVLAGAGWDPETGALDAVTVSLMSFHPGSLAVLAEHVGAPILMPLLDEVEPDDEWPVPLDQVRALHAAAVAMVDDGRAGGAGPSLRWLVGHPRTVARWRAAGRALRVWTVDTVDGLEACRDAGVTEVTTNDPAGLRAAASRG